MKQSRVGFTIVEIIVVVLVVATLVAIVAVGYGAWRHNSATSSVQNDLQHATTALKSYQNFKNDYPPNLAGVNFASSVNVALKLYTNAQQVRVYTSLTPSENAQLFLNSCNALMPLESGGVTYNTSCTFAGNNVHVQGTNASNIVWQGPTINESDVILTCGSVCDAAMQSLRATFEQQGGGFPISVPKNNVTLPAYTTYSDGPATRFCLEAVSGMYDDIIYHTSSEQATMVTGPCPEDPELHYP